MISRLSPCGYRRGVERPVYWLRDLGRGDGESRCNLTPYSAFAERLACHCDERGDEAISTPGVGDCFASLAMTDKIVPSDDFVFALHALTAGS